MEIYIMETDGSAIHRLTMHPAAVVDIHGIRTGIIVCSDIQSRIVRKTLKKQQVALILGGLASPKDPNFFISGMIAKLFDSWIVIANRYGKEDGYVYDGNMMISNPLGEIVQQSIEQEQILCQRTEYARKENMKMMLQVEFESSGNMLKGYFFPAQKTPAIASIIFLQGFPGIGGDELICEQLARKNVNVLTFNYQGTFQSKGFFSFSNVISDIGAAIQFMEEPSNQEKYGVDLEKLVLGGWSFGSGLVPAGAIKYAAISKMFCISGRDFGAEARRIMRNLEYKQEVFQNLDLLFAQKRQVSIR